MIEIQKSVHETIPEAVMLARLAQSEQMREFYIEMWKQNPSLAKQGGARVQSLLLPLAQIDAETKPVSPLGNRGVGSQRGVSLIELIIFIVIISVALTGILLVMNQVTAHSADPLVHKQALAAAESLLEEIELQDFSMPSGVTATSGTVDATNRATGYHIVSDYHNFSSTGILSVDGTPIAGLENYNASVTVVNTALGAIAAGSAVLITVTVTDPQNTPISISSFRTAY